MTLFRPITKTMVALVACLSLAQSVSAAGNLYRYKDADGNPVISHTLPQDASLRGYQILNSSGRVQETVAPALTDEERAAKAAQEAERARQAELAKQRQAEDRQLLRTYSHPDDAIMALRRKLVQMRSLISLKEGNIANMKSQVRQEQSRAAEAERAGRTVPDQILAKIDGLEAEIAETESEIQHQNAEITATIAQYEAMVVRLEELTETKRSMPLERANAQAGG